MMRGRVYQPYNPSNTINAMINATKPIPPPKPVPFAMSFLRIIVKTIDDKIAAATRPPPTTKHMSIMDTSAPANGIPCRYKTTVAINRRVGGIVVNIRALRKLFIIYLSKVGHN